MKKTLLSSLLVAGLIGTSFGGFSREQKEAFTVVTNEAQAIVFWNSLPAESKVNMFVVQTVFHKISNPQFVLNNCPAELNPVKVARAKSDLNDVTGAKAVLEDFINQPVADDENTLMKRTRTWVVNDLMKAQYNLSLLDRATLIENTLTTSMPPSLGKKDRVIDLLRHYSDIRWELPADRVQTFLSTIDAANARPLVRDEEYGFLWVKYCTALID